MLEETDFDRSFYGRLRELRLDMNAVSADCRPALQRMADQIEREHLQMQHDCKVVQNMADDLSLKVAATMFNIWACRQEAVACARMTLS